jgi:hypothetical protein
VDVSEEFARQQNRFLTGSKDRKARWMEWSGRREV